MKCIDRINIVYTNEHVYFAFEMSDEKTSWIIKIIKSGTVINTKKKVRLFRLEHKAGQLTAHTRTFTSKKSRQRRNKETKTETEKIPAKLKVSVEKKSGEKSRRNN